MKIIGVEETIFPEVKVITYGRFPDERGYFSETYKKSDFQNNPQLSFLKDFKIMQANVSFSKKNVVRGLHFQWNPYMGKLIRTINGYMIDLFLDIRRSSPTYGKIGVWKMSSDVQKAENQLIWVPKGFAHGGVFVEDTLIEYYCDSEWNPQGETSISPFAPDIDWSLAKEGKEELNKVISQGIIISQKDKDGHTLETWSKQPAATKFTF